MKSKKLGLAGRVILGAATLASSAEAGRLTISNNSIPGIFRCETYLVHHDIAPDSLFLAPPIPAIDNYSIEGTNKWQRDVRNDMSTYNVEIAGRGLSEPTEADFYFVITEFDGQNNL